MVENLLPETGARHSKTDEGPALRGSSSGSASRNGSGGSSDPGGGGQDGNQGSDRDENESGGAGTATISKPKSKTKTPSLYRVILINDDFTPMDFVIHVLQKFFQKEYDEATRIMLQIHHQGFGVCGVFSYEIAETKVYQVNQYSRQNRHPLKCTMERA